MPSSTSALSRHSGGIRCSGSSCIGHRNVLVPAGDVLQLRRQHPVEGVERALGRARVVLEALLQQAGDGALGAAHRAVQQEHAPLGAVALGRALEDVDQPHERDVEAEDGVAPAVRARREEAVADEPLLVVDVLLLPVATGSCRRAAGTRVRATAGFLRTMSRYSSKVPVQWSSANSFRFCRDPIFSIEMLSRFSTSVLGALAQLGHAFSFPAQPGVG